MAADEEFYWEEGDEVGELMQSEDLLITRAQSGDRDALNAIIAEYWPPIFRFVSYKTGSPEDAQELTQETFFRAFRSLSDYRQTTATFKTYLSRIALNLVRDHWRNRGRNPVLVDIADCQEAAAANDQPDVQTIRAERSRSIAAVLQELPDEQRRAVELRIITGLPVSETALAMGKSEAAVKMLQQRALKSLRQLLVKRGIVETSGDWR